MHATEKVFLPLPLFRSDKPVWKTSSRVMHDYERSHGQHFQQSQPQNISMEWRYFEPSVVTGVCWCHTCKRRPTRKLFWIHRLDSETDRSSRSTAKNCVQRSQTCSLIKIPVCCTTKWAHWEYVWPCWYVSHLHYFLLQRFFHNIVGCFLVERGSVLPCFFVYSHFCQ